MNASAGELRMTTADNQGIWFGFNGSNADSTLGASSQGNYVGLRTKLSAGATEWSVYLYDQSHGAAFLFDHDGYTYMHDLLGAYGETSEAIDLTTYHDFAFWLKDGVVSYAVDGVLKFSGTAHASGASKILVIGDGSGSTFGGAGTMYIDSSAVTTAGDYAGAPAIPVLAAAAIPEPSSAFLLAGGAALIGLARLRRR